MKEVTPGGLPAEEARDPRTSVWVNRISNDDEDEEGCGR
jgi:hypothetical protein